MEGDISGDKYQRGRVELCNGSTLVGINIRGVR